MLHYFPMLDKDFDEQEVDDEFQKSIDTMLLMLRVNMSTKPGFEAHKGMFLNLIQARSRINMKHFLKMSPSTWSTPLLLSELANFVYSHRDRLSPHWCEIDTAEPELETAFAYKCIKQIVCHKEEWKKEPKPKPVACGVKKNLMEAGTSEPDDSETLAFTEENEDKVVPDKDLDELVASIADDDVASVAGEVVAPVPNKVAGDPFDDEDDVFDEDNLWEKAAALAKQQEDA